MVNHRLAAAQVCLDLSSPYCRCSPLSPLRLGGILSFPHKSATPNNSEVRTSAAVSPCGSRSILVLPPPLFAHLSPSPPQDRPLQAALVKARQLVTDDANCIAFL